jgi:hypothetical protein
MERAKMPENILNEKIKRIREIADRQVGQVAVGDAVRYLESIEN